MDFKLIFHILIIIIAISLIFTKDYIDLIVSYAVFSLFAAALYYFNFAPDVAIAEIAIGAAFVPLIFIITVSKQKRFIVTGDVINRCFIDDEGECINILQAFADLYNLELEVLENVEEEDLQLTGVFRSVNIDMYIREIQDGDAYYFIGKESSILMKRMEKMTDKYNNIRVILVPDIEVFEGGS
jgi:uncharacterized MnhB-related membrane protein